MVSNKDIYWIYGKIQERCENTKGIEKSILRDVLALFDAAPEKWIPVTERLPDKEYWEYQKKYSQDKMEVLVMIEGAWIPTTLYFDDDGDFIDDDGDAWLVTHWQPMPRPPKEGTHEAEP